MDDAPVPENLDTIWVSVGNLKTTPMKEHRVGLEKKDKSLQTDDTLVLYPALDGPNGESPSQPPWRISLLGIQPILVPRGTSPLPSPTTKLYPDAIRLSIMCPPTAPHVDTYLAADQRTLARWQSKLSYIHAALRMR